MPPQAMHSEGYFVFAMSRCLSRTNVDSPALHSTAGQVSPLHTAEALCDRMLSEALELCHIPIHLVV